MKNKILLFGLIFLFGCNNVETNSKRFFSNLMYFEEGFVSINSQELTVVSNEHDLNGVVQHGVDLNILSKGNYINGHKSGEWKYPCYEDLTLSWETDTLDQGVFTMPSEWEYYFSDDSSVWYTFPVESGLENNKYFHLSEFSAVDTSLEEYASQLWRNIDLDSNFYSTFFYKLHYNNKWGYYSILFKIENGEELLILDFLGEIEGRKFEAIYRSSNIDWSLKYTVFFEVLKGIELDSGFLLPPIGSMWQGKLIKENPPSTLPNDK